MPIVTLLAQAPASNQDAQEKKLDAQDPESDREPMKWRNMSWTGVAAELHDFNTTCPSLSLKALTSPVADILKHAEPVPPEPPKPP